VAGAAILSTLDRSGLDARTRFDTGGGERVN